MTVHVRTATPGPRQLAREEWGPGSHESAFLGETSCFADGSN